MAEFPDDRSPNPVDLHVGARVRMRRRLAGVSQEKLAEALGLTFQQVQKYERGANRVSASKLYEIAAALQTPVAFFFEGLADPSIADNAKVQIGAEQFVHDFLMTSEGLELASLFPRLRRGPLRRRLLDLVRAIVEDGDEDGEE
ncbi:MAG TPA: helix-turn-helix transcriptional regulator [Caulobacteraceae bacterium]|jgi:transcriptional regulator with XRE-family HTH domain|nr:helix-turn-helix transcriptional regulator [Caulobacteraceae bacterium]